MKKLLGMAAALVLMVSWQKNSIEGSWVQPIPGMENEMQGIKLEKGGKASSINMHTLLYASWKKEGDKLVLEGESIGNGQTVKFQDEYTILKLNDRELILGAGDAEFNYSRRKIKKKKEGEK